MVLSLKYSITRCCPAAGAWLVTVALAVLPLTGSLVLIELVAVPPPEEVSVVLVAVLVAVLPSSWLVVLLLSMRFVIVVLASARFVVVLEEARKPGGFLVMI